MRPLDGVVIVDVTEAMQGPFAVSLLADLGAYAVRIERPTGELMRRIGPYRKGSSLPLLGVARGRAAYVALDLKTDAGHTRLLELIRHADVFIENWKPGTAERLGLAADDLRRVNPEVVYLSSSGFGRTGPLAGAASMDAIAAGVSGFGAVTGPPDGDGELVRFPIVDALCAFVLVELAAAALLQRSITGASVRGETSQLETGVAAMAPALAANDAEVRAGPGDRWSVPARMFQTRDGLYVAIAVETDVQWVALRDALAVEAPCGWDHWRSRMAAREDVEEAVAASAVTLDRADLVRLLRKIGVPAAAVRRSVAEALADRGISDGHVSWRRDDRAGWVAVPRSPWEFAGSDVAVSALCRELEVPDDARWREIVEGAASVRAKAARG